MNMRNWILAPFFCFMVLSMPRCDKNETIYKYNGEITGLDFRKCACQTPRCGCCGAWVIEIDKSAYYFIELPKESGITLSQDGPFPIPVRLNFITDPESCGPQGHYILITEIERR